MVIVALISVYALVRLVISAIAVHVVKFAASGIITEFGNRL